MTGRNEDLRKEVRRPLKEGRLQLYTVRKGVMRVVYPWQPRRENEVNANNAKYSSWNGSKMVEESWW